MHGQGKFTWKSGETYEGSWENGDMNGYGIRVFDSGNKYEGQWANDNK
jgi:hypothetical protein